ncbi:S4 domain-containing protein [Rossellomorea sp. BNER]|uniref:S4 domain-containing protein n=1 Tax=Rossellomorea sp. BNER TaxID=2962031 RepID=UPI003AF2CE69|nr:S4 domain-containing protein [Rossellomorea sp. BNER]
MKSLELVWNLVDQEHELYMNRHCSNCGKVVTFKDTLIRRHNANGKNIYRFAIYKCEKNHTWNRKLEIYKTYENHVRLYRELPPEEDVNVMIDIEEQLLNGYGFIEITIGYVHGHFRIDKVLSERVKGWSRSLISRKIKEGLVRVNDEEVKQSTKISEGDIVVVMLK